MTFWKTVGAYLTGWVIAQSFFNRVWKHLMRNQDSKDWSAFHDELAVRLAPLLAGELERLRTGEGYEPSESGLKMFADRTMDNLIGTGDRAKSVTREEMQAAMTRASADILGMARERA